MARVREGNGKEEEQIEQGVGVTLMESGIPGRASSWLVPGLSFLIRGEEGDGSWRLRMRPHRDPDGIPMGSTRGIRRPSPTAGPGAGHLPRKETEMEQAQTWMGLRRTAEVVAEAGAETGWVAGIRGMVEAP